METIDGLVLESKYPDLSYIVKGPIQDEWRDGIPVRRPKHIVLEFDRYLLEMDQLIREKELDEEDKLFIKRQLEYEFSKPNFVDFWVHEKPIPAPPWPTYDDTHHAQVASIAEAVGLVPQALHYEVNGRPGGPRTSVVEKLQAMQNAEAEGIPFIPDGEDALSAV